MALTNYELWSFRDAIEHVLDGTVSGDKSARNLRSARRAVFEAYRDLPNKREWRYYHRRYQFASSAEQTSSTLVFDYTGGTYERMATIAAGTWPSDAIFYELIIDNVRYEVEDRKTSTIITLTERANPGADVAAGTSYTLARNSYPLPDDFGSLDTLAEVGSNGFALEHVYLDEFLRRRSHSSEVEQSTYYTTVPTPKYAGGLAILLGPSPTSAEYYELAYRARPRQPRVELYNIGSVTTTASSAVVTGTSTAFAAAHVGCVLRISADDNPPATLIGSLLDTNVSTYCDQGIIKSVDSATQVTLQQAVSTAVTTKPYTISDHLDVEAGAMWTYFLRLCEAYFAQFESRKDAPERLALAELAFQQAAWSDQRGRAVQYSGGEITSLADIAGEVDVSP